MSDKDEIRQILFAISELPMQEKIENLIIYTQKKVLEREVELGKEFIRKIAKINQEGVR